MGDNSPAAGHLDHVSGGNWAGIARRDLPPTQLHWRANPLRGRHTIARVGTPRADSESPVRIPIYT